MLKKIIFTVISLIIVVSVFGQCKIKTKGAVLKSIEKRTPLDIELMTKIRVLFDKYTVVATNTFVKTTDGDYYFIIPFSRAYSSRFEAFEETPVIFYLDGGDELKLFPDGENEGRMVGLTTFQIFLYYKISKEQIEKLASNDILSLRIYFISEKEIANTYEDNLGRYYEFEIFSDKYRTNVFDAANCILQY